MKETSDHLSEREFNERGARYHRAMAAAPAARSLELAPYALLLGNALRGRATENLVAADVLCGPGILTRAFGPAFKRVVGLDVSAEMLSHYPAGAQVEAMRAPLSDQQALLEQVRPDVILGLAGLHHVFVVEEGRIDPEASTDLQVATLCAWASTLAPGGVLLAADATHSSVAVEYSRDESLLVPPGRALEACFRSLTASASLPGDVPLPRSRAEHVARVLRAAPVPTSATPARWFREAVNAHGMYGHSDHFLHPDLIVAGVRARGLQIEYCELPTPWCFRSADEMVFFCHELFAFGPAAEEPGDVGAARREKILGLLRGELGVFPRENGAVAVGWRLGYYVVHA